MRQAAHTAAIALAVLACLVVAGTVAQVVMGAGPYLLMFLLDLQADWQITAAVAVAWFVALAPIIVGVCAVAHAVVRRGDSVAGIMLGVAAYPAACVALVILTPESWMETRWIGFGHGIVAVPMAIGVAVVWALIRPARLKWADANRRTEGVAPAPRWRPVS